MRISNKGEQHQERCCTIKWGIQRHFFKKTPLLYGEKEVSRILSCTKPPLLPRPPPPPQNNPTSRISQWGEKRKRPLLRTIRLLLLLPLYSSSFRTKKEVFKGYVGILFVHPLHFFPSSSSYISLESFFYFLTVKTCCCSSYSSSLLTSTLPEKKWGVENNFGKKIKHMKNRKKWTADKAKYLSFYINIFLSIFSGDTSSVGFTAHVFFFPVLSLSTLVGFPKRGREKWAAFREEGILPLLPPTGRIPPLSITWRTVCHIQVSKKVLKNFSRITKRYRLKVQWLFINSCTKNLPHFTHKLAFNKFLLAAGLGKGSVELTSLLRFRLIYEVPSELAPLFLPNRRITRPWQDPIFPHVLAWEYWANFTCFPIPDTHTLSKGKLGMAFWARRSGVPNLDGEGGKLSWSGAQKNSSFLPLRPVAKFVFRAMRELEAMCIQNPKPFFVKRYFYFLSLFFSVKQKGASRTVFREEEGFLRLWKKKKMPKGILPISPSSFLPFGKQVLSPILDIRVLECKKNKKIVIVSLSL